MSHKHKAWRPLPAAKPSHLATNVPNRPVQSLAALQGATSAFISTPKTTSSAVKPLRSQYEPSLTITNVDSELHAGFSGEQDELRDKRELRRSPSRGRHLSPQDAQLAGAKSAVAGGSRSIPPPLDRTQSMVAARLASASSSPVRDSLSISTLRGPGSSPNSTNMESNSLKASRIVTRPALTASSSSEHNARAGKAFTSAANLDFGKLPRLLPRTAYTSAEGTVTSPTEETHLESRHVQENPIPSSKTVHRKTSDSQLLDAASNQGVLRELYVEPHLTKTKPPTPAPRRTRPTAHNALQPNLTGPKQVQGLSREEAINRMADAMVASSLASTRNPSPTKALHGQASRRRSASAHNLYRIPSVAESKQPYQPKPQRPMKQTLRKESPEDDEDGLEANKRGRRHLVRKHPNMHHEGDRKRWRDKVTEAERRRYEGVFAANRGLLLKSVDPNSSPSRFVDPSSEGNQVANVVTRDIWERSRLSPQVLEQIYDLVAPDNALSLNREQFVVGLWLIDQKLKGRKLPLKVSESVWASVRHSQGIKLGGHG